MPGPGTGSVDGPSYSDYVNLVVDYNQQTAATQNVKAQMLLVGDTLVVSIGDQGQQLRVMGSKANMPTLAPIVQQRITQKAITSDPAEVQSHAEALVNLMQETLTPELQRAIYTELQKSPEERDPQIMALFYSLDTMADLVVWAKSVGAPTEVSVQQASKARTEGLRKFSSGAMGALNQLAGNLQAEVDSPFTSPGDKIIYSEYLKFVIEVTRMVRQLLQLIEASDAKEHKKTTQTQAQATIAKLNKQLAEFKKQLEIARKAGKMQNVMKIVSIVVAVVAVLAAALTGGAAAILIAVALTVVTQVGPTQEGLNKAMAAIMGQMSDTFGGDVGGMIATLVIIVVIALVVRKVATVPVGGLNQGFKVVTTEAGKKAINASATTVGLQTFTTLGSSSGCILKGVSSLGKSCGMGDSDAEMLAMIVQMLIMLLAGLLGGAFMQKSGEMAAMAQSMTPLVAKSAMALDVAGQVVQGGASSYEAVQHFEIALMKLEQGKLEEAIAELETVMELLGAKKESIKAAMENLHGLIELIGDVVQQLLRSRQKTDAQLFQG